VRDGDSTPLGSLGGFTVSVSFRRRMTQVPVLTLSLDGVPESDVGLTAGELGEAALVTRLENRLTALERLRDDPAVRIDRLRAEVGKADELLAKPFALGKELAAARVRVQDIAEELKKAAAPDPNVEVVQVVDESPHEEAMLARQALRQEWPRARRRRRSPCRRVRQVVERRRCDSLRTARS
jgi:hypothetical protein